MREAFGKADRGGEFCARHTRQAEMLSGLVREFLGGKIARLEQLAQVRRASFLRIALQRGKLFGRYVTLEEQRAGEARELRVAEGQLKTVP